MQLAGHMSTKFVPASIAPSIFGWCLYVFIMFDVGQVLQSLMQTKLQTD